MRRILTLIMPIILFYSNGVKAQETVLSLGTSNQAIQSTENLSTAQIDGVLRGVAPSIFGQNFTRDKSNKLFSDLENLRNGLAISLRQTIASLPETKQVYSLTVSPIIPDLRLSQNTNSVSGELKATTLIQAHFEYNISGIKSIFCTSASVRFDITNIKASADYNFITGNINNSSVTYDLLNVKASCNGILGFVGNTLGSPSTVARRQIVSTINAQINQQIEFINMQRLFSLRDFASALTRFGQESLLAPFTNKLLFAFNELINEAGINTPGVTVRLYALRSQDQISPNFVGILASHTPVNIDTVSCENAVEGNIPANTSKIDIYIMPPRLNARWTLYESIPVGAEGRFYSVIEGVPANTGVTAIATNATFAGLESFPDKVISTNDVRNCYPIGDGLNF